MRKNDTVHLNSPATSIADPHDSIVGLCKGKSVLNVGAAGNASHYIRLETGDWLHAKLDQIVENIVGLDLDCEEVSAANKAGFNIVCGNCETEQLGQSFEVIVMSDVLEHIDNPADALKNMFHHLSDGGKIVITTPNATFLGNIVNGILCRPPNVYWDHVQLYTPENLQALCDRHGWHLQSTAFFSLYDRRTLFTKLKSMIASTVCAMFPRFHSSFMSILVRKDGVEAKS